jgi:predicted ArsR family transcriptional regulator
MTGRDNAGDGESPRRRVRTLLAEDPREWDVAELSEATGLHANTLRGHLQILVDLGQVSRRSASGGVPGRPRTLYRICGGDSAAENPYRQLAAELALGLAHADSAGAAEAAGRAWGSRVKRQQGLPDAVTLAEVIDVAVDAMGDLGFEAQTEPLGDRMYLTKCPFAELARSNPSVCDVHAGLLSGLLAEVGGSVELARLDPFVRDSLCVAHLRPTSGGDR